MKRFHLKMLTVKELLPPTKSFYRGYFIKTFKTYECALRQTIFVQETKVSIHLLIQKYRVSHSNPNSDFVHSFNSYENILMKFVTDLTSIMRNATISKEMMELVFVRVKGI